MRLSPGRPCHTLRWQQGRQGNQLPMTRLPLAFVIAFPPPRFKMATRVQLLNPQLWSEGLGTWRRLPKSSKVSRPEVATNLDAGMGVADEEVGRVWVHPALTTIVVPTKWRWPMLTPYRPVADVWTRIGCSLRGRVKYRKHRVPMLNDVVIAQNCLVVFVQPGDAPRRERRHILDDATVYTCFRCLESSPRH